MYLYKKIKPFQIHSSSITTLLLFMILIVILPVSEGIRAEMKKPTINLPKTMGSWTRTDSAKMVNSKNIFDYMNGAGELYLAYRFDHLEVYEYTAKDQYNILVELYFMKSADDAYGLISQDWGGEPQNLNNSSSGQEPGSNAPSFSALYGKGLLRIWSDNLYARILAFQETPLSRQTVLEMGRLIVANRLNPSPPELLNILPATLGSNWKLRRNTMSFFRSHLVLNSFYFLSHQNILNLSLSTEATFSQYEKYPRGEKRITIQFLYINYFYDGWVGYDLNGQYLTCVFECPDQSTARMVLDKIKYKK